MLQCIPVPRFVIDCHLYIYIPLFSLFVIHRFLSYQINTKPKVYIPAFHYLNWISLWVPWMHIYFQMPLWLMLQEVINNLQYMSLFKRACITYDLVFSKIWDCNFATFWKCNGFGLICKGSTILIPRTLFLFSIPKEIN